MLGFWASTASAAMALILFLCGIPRYRHFTPKGNPLSRVSQVVVAAIRKWKVQIMNDSEGLFDDDEKELVGNGARKILHTNGFK